MLITSPAISPVTSEPIEDRYQEIYSIDVYDFRMNPTDDYPAGTPLRGYFYYHLEAEKNVTFSGGSTDNVSYLPQFIIQSFTVGEWRFGDKLENIMFNIAAVFKIDEMRFIDVNASVYFVQLDTDNSTVATMNIFNISMPDDLRLGDRSDFHSTDDTKKTYVFRENMTFANWDLVTLVDASIYDRYPPLTENDTPFWGKVSILGLLIFGYSRKRKFTGSS